MSAALGIGLGLTGLSALSGLFGKKQTSDTSYNQTTTPTYDPTNQAFRDFLIGQFTKNVKDMPGYEQAYTTGGLRNINMGVNRSNQAIQDILSSRGLGRTTAGAGILGEGAVSGAGQTASFLNNIPIVMDQLKQQRLAAAGGYQASLPVGQTQLGSSHTVGNVPGGFGPAISAGAGNAAGYLGNWAANRDYNDTLKTIFANPRNGADMSRIF